VLLHGIGGPGDHYRAVAERLAGEGIAGVVFNWMMRDKDPPDAIVTADLEACAHYLAAQPELDPDRIAIGGYCAGGTRSMLALAEVRLFRAGVIFHGIPIYSDRVVFISDLSGSMESMMPVKDEPQGTGERDKTPAEPKEKSKLEVSKAELTKTVQSLPDEVHFNIVTFATNVGTWQKAIVAASKSAKATATEFIAKLKIEGRTNFFGALAKPLEDPQVDTVYFLTDGGVATDGKYIDHERIIRRLHELNKYSLVEINCFLFGAEGNVSSRAVRWMEMVAAESGGKFYIRPETGNWKLGIGNWEQ
jgi:dienelactone hydrolase